MQNMKAQTKEKKEKWDSPYFILLNKKINELPIEWGGDLLKSANYIWEYSVNLYPWKKTSLWLTDMWQEKHYVQLNLMLKTGFGVSPFPYKAV